jgi:peroxiredoxin
MRCAAALVLLVAVSSLACGGEPPQLPDRPVAGFKLQDTQGAWHALEDLKDKKVVVIAFLGTECPLAQRYAGRLAELDAELGPKEVAFLGIDSNQQDSLAAITHLARTHKIRFPLLKDPGGTVADQLDARRTPEVFVLDSKRKVRYRGRIDDQYGVGYSRPRPTRRDLAEAVEEVLADKPVSRPLTAAAGCFIARSKRKTPQGSVTYSKQISRILQSRCISCHRAGSIAPFALTSYRSAAAWADTIREVIADRRMPPWDADPRFGKFANDCQMPEEEKKLVYRWVDNGTPEGDAHDLPPKSTFTEGWQIPKPDLVVSMPKPFTVPAKGTVRYQYIEVDPGLKEDRWVQAAEAQPGNRSVVHHILVFIIPPERVGIRDQELDLTSYIGVSAPGIPPVVYPRGEAKLLRAGSHLLFQMHYTPNGSVQTDQSRVGFVYADPKTVRRQVRTSLALNMEFRIPAGSENHLVEASLRTQQPMLLFSLFPHMHLRGKSFRIEAVYPSKRHEILLNVPRYRFDWQNVYVLDEPKLLPEGTELRCIGHFDNSANNLSNPDPKATVHWGEQTWEEMMVGYFDMALADQDLRLGPPRVKPLEGGKYEVTFQYAAPAGTKAVYLAGSFNGWKPTGHKMDGPDSRGRFTTKLTLDAGSHEYKFVLEGKTWKEDPGNPVEVGFYHNSVLVLKK